MNKLASIIIAGAFGGTLFGCTSLDRETAGRSGTIRARGADAVVSGGHCESSALANALRAIGYDVAESDIIGGGGAPSFMFSADGFPFLGGRSARMRETFFAAGGIPFRVVIPGAERNAQPSGTPAESVWQRVFSLVESGVPVPLRVDMRFLPYRYGGKYGPSYMEFGWHWITLFAVDFDTKTAFVSDTEYRGLQGIRLTDLEKARTSKTKAWRPRAEYLELTPASARRAPDPEPLIDSALGTMIGNYEGRDTWTDSASATPLPIPVGLAGLEAFPALLRDFDSQVKPWLAGPGLSFLGGCIERNGTGGAAFRVLFREFIARCADSESGRLLRELLAPLDESIASWRSLAAEFDAAGAAISGKTKTAERRAWYERCAVKAEAVAAAERALYEEIKRIRSRITRGES